MVFVNLESLPLAVSAPRRSRQRDPSRSCASRSWVVPFKAEAVADLGETEPHRGDPSRSRCAR